MSIFLMYVHSIKGEFFFVKPILRFIRSCEHNTVTVRAMLLSPGLCGAQSWKTNDEGLLICFDRASLIEHNPNVSVTFQK